MTIKLDFIEALKGGSSENSNKTKSNDGQSESNSSSLSKKISPRMEKFRAIFEDTVMEEKNSFIKREHEIVELLINQSLYPYNQLKSMALENIYLLFRDSQTMARRIDDLQIIDDTQSMKEQDALEEISHYLFRLGETMEVWYTNDSEEKIE